MTTSYLDFPDLHLEEQLSNAKKNSLFRYDEPVHDWYRFVLSYPPQLVRKYLSLFDLNPSKKVLDPFCGTGTTNIECKLLQIPSVGVEYNPFSFFASKVKAEWAIDPSEFETNSLRVAEKASDILKKDGINDDRLLIDPNIQLRSLSEASEQLLIKDSISPLPKHKAIILLECIREFGHPEFVNYQKLAFAKTLVFFASNLVFGPEVGVGKIKENTPVISVWMKEIRKMARDIQSIKSNLTSCDIYQIDARDLGPYLEPMSIDAVITSPPYPNEKDYTRTTRLESVFLDFLTTKDDLRLVKNGLVRSNTRGIYRLDDDFHEIEDIPEIMELSEKIESRRIELNKTSGFERMYHKVTLNYFGGMALHFKNLRPVLKSGAKLAYVVGDQASYFRILIRTGQLLSKVAQKYGYEVNGIDLFRTRLATATRSQLNEEVLLLQWPG